MNRIRTTVVALLAAAATGLALTAAGQAADGGSPGGGAAPQGTPAWSNLPDMGSGANAILTRTEERQIGRMVLRQLRQENLVFEDPESTEYIQALGERIGAQAQDGEHAFTFFIFRDTAVNASAFLGGYIGTNVGLILLSQSESELGGVLAHEIGHVVQRHMVRAIEAQSRNGLTTMAAMLGAILLGAVTGSADAAPGLIAMAQGTAMQQQINFTRMEEQEADRVGIGFLAAAGLDPNGIAAFFEQQMRNNGPNLGGMPDLLRSHPVDAQRIADARARTLHMPRRRSESESFRFIRERLRVLATSRDDLRGYYAGLVTNGVREPWVYYGRALADLKAGDAPAAVALLRKLIAENPDQSLLHAALGQAQVAASDQDGALLTLARANELFPRNVPVTVRYAETLLAAGRPGQAHQLLLDVFNNATPTPSQIQLTAQAASAAGDTGDSHYYMAEYHLATGDLMLANQQLELALADPSLSDVQRKRFVARRDEIREVLREQRQRGRRG